MQRKVIVRTPKSIWTNKKLHIRSEEFIDLNWQEAFKVSDIHDPLKDDLTAQIRRLAEQLKGEEAINQAIARADPLEANQAFLSLPELNEHQDTEGIRELLNRAVTGAQSFSGSNFIHCSAAIRDISILAASLVRFGIEPADCVPGFSEVLMALSASAKTQIPRDSFIDYTSRNPDDTRERTFTSLPQEKIFIDSLRRGMAALHSCLVNVLEGCTFPFSSKEFSSYFSAATQSFQTMIDMIVQVKRGITPEVFTHHIRPFFEPFRVGDRAFSAPSGAEMPILNIDQIIWGSDCEDELYTFYFQANVIRLPAIYQEISQAVTGKKSLITLLKDRMASGIPLSHEERMSIQELHRLLTRMYSFRMPHYKVAEENVILRQHEQGAGQEVKGSSGFGLVETKYVLDQTIKCRQITSQALAFNY